jgi:hypothetical protein
MRAAALSQMLLLKQENKYFHIFLAARFFGQKYLAPTHWLDEFANSTPAYLIIDQSYAAWD